MDYDIESILQATWPPISRVQLAKYAGASGDWNPMHLDPDLAKQAGLKDVIAHGMLTMAYVAQYARDSTPGSLRRIKVRFRSMVQLDDQITCSVEHVAVRQNGLLLKILATTQNGDIVANGEAELTWSGANPREGTSE